MIENKSFQERHRWHYFLFAAVGYYAPGLGQLIPTRLIRLLFKSFSICMLLIGFAGQMAIYVYLYLNSPPFLIFLLLFRRAVVFTYGTCRIFTGIFFRGKLEQIYKMWDATIMNDPMTFSTKKREEILQENEKSYHKIMGRSVLLSTTFPVLYGLLFLVHPYSKGAQFSGYPHDIDSPYHMHYIVFQCFVLTICLSAGSYEFMSAHLLSLLASQLQYLEESLSDIIETVTVDKMGNLFIQDIKVNAKEHKRVLKDKGKEVDRKLKVWIREHQNTLRWSHVVAKYLQLDTAVKFMFLLIYTCSVAFSIPKLIKDGRLNDTVLAVFFACGMMSIHFYGTRLADRIFESSNTLFLSAYGKPWFVYPIGVQRSLSIIAKYTSERPIKITTLAVVSDNTETFMSILNIAYRGLSVLLQVPDDD